MTPRELHYSSLYRIILFDQREAGRSEPLASTEHNETADLIGDLETIRRRLDVSQWLVFGSSWGSTLALAYCASHPRAVRGPILRGIWLGRDEDIDWLMDGKTFADFVPPAERDDLLEAYWRRLSSPDPTVHLPAAVAWRLWERRCEALLPSKDLSVPADTRTLAIARIEAHYMRNQTFLPAGWLIAGAAEFRDVPGIIIHGRYDMLATVDAAVSLSEAWPSADLEIIPDAGHSTFEPGICSRLVAAADHFACLPSWD